MGAKRRSGKKRAGKSQPEKREGPPTGQPAARSVPGSFYFLAALAYSHSGADLAYRAYLAPSLQYFFLRGWHDLDLTVAALLKLAALLLLARPLWHYSARFSRMVRGCVWGAVFCFFLLHFIVWHTLQIQTDWQIVLFLFDHLSLLSQAPSVITEVPLMVWLFAGVTIVPLSMLLVKRQQSRPEGSASWQAGFLQTATAVLLFLVVQLDLHAALLSNQSKTQVEKADWPAREQMVAPQNVPSFFFQKRYGFQPALPRVFIIFILESARAEFVDLNRSRFFGSKGKKLTIADFFVPVPHSSNSHYSLFTAMHSSRRAHENFATIQAEHSLPGMLGAKGYRSIYLYGGDARFDKEHQMLQALKMENIDMASLKRKYRQEKLFWWGLDDRLLIQEAREIIENDARPLFLTIVYTNSHHPYPALPHRKENRFPTTEATGRHRNAIDYAMDLSDELLEFLNERKEDTFAILLSDHGESFGEHGFIMHDFSLYNTEVKIPFAMYSPDFRFLFGDLPERGTILDVWPTVADLFGLPIEVPLHGRSLFDPDYKFNLLLRSWTNTDYSGIIFGERKWIYSAPGRRLSLLDLSDQLQGEFTRKEAHTFIDDLHAALP